MDKDQIKKVLADHADCERKASGMAMSLVAKYPDRTPILKDHKRFESKSR